MEEGDVLDMVSIGRDLLADPYCPKKVRKGKTEEIRPCIACHDGCLSKILEGKPLSCAVNPACGREVEYNIPVARNSKNIMIICYTSFE